MPSNTFLNLPPGKQEKLLEAATKEFSRRSFADASINQIIKDAGIPRGSFYMYFRDKEDLFRYLMRGYVDQMISAIEQLLIREQGDIFQALTELFGYIQDKWEERRLGEMGAMSAIIARNAGVEKTAILDIISPEEIVGRLGQQVNTDRLNLQSEGDLNDILAVLLVVSGPMIFNGAVHGTGFVSKAHYSNVLEILKRGMSAVPAATHN